MLISVVFSENGLNSTFFLPKSTNTVLNETITEKCEIFEWLSIKKEYKAGLNLKFIISF